MGHLGKFSEQVKGKYEDRIRYLRTEPGRTDAWRRRELAKLAVEMKAERDRLVADAERADERRRQDMENRVFGTVGVEGDSASVSISRRDAGDRAASLDSQHEAMQLLNRADRSGDEVLARAIAERAWQMSWLEVANAFADKRPQLQGTYQELWDLKGAGRRGTSWFGDGLIASTMIPEELSGLSAYDIERVAGSPDSSVSDPKVHSL